MQVLAIKVTYVDGTIERFHEDDYPEFQDRHGIDKKNYLLYTHTSEGFFRIDTHKTHKLIPVNQIRKIHVTEKK